MQKMDGTHFQNQKQYLSDAVTTELNKRGVKKSTKFDIPGDTISATARNHESAKSTDNHVEITLDVSEDLVGGANAEDNELTLQAKALEKRSAFGSSAVKYTSMKIRQVSRELQQLTSLSERPQKQYDRSKSGAVDALTGLTFLSKTDSGSDWMKVEKKFDELTVSTNGLLSRALFWECIGKTEVSKGFAEELFDAIARRRNIKGNSINKQELKEFWEQISDQSFDSRLRTFFDMVDKDANGMISKDEVKEIISLSAAANKLSSIKNQADEYSTLIMKELDPDNHGFIMIENMEMLLLQAAAHPVRGAESKALDKLPSQKLKSTNDHAISRTYKDIKYFVLVNWQRVLVLALWIGIMAGLFAYKYVQYKNKAAYEVMAVCVCLAKGAAETLKFNMALILLPVCRNTLTWLRNKTKLGVVVPFDSNIKFHQIITVGIAIGIGIHGMAHLICDFPRLLHADKEKYELMEPFFGNDQPPNYWWFVKGVEGVTGIVMVVLMAIAFTLASPWLRLRKVKKGKDPRANSPKDQNEKGSLEKILDKLTGFNAFWYSHHLFVIVYALLIVHGIKLYLTHDWSKKTTWMYLAVPIILYACERFIRAYRSSVKNVHIKKVVVYPENLLALHVFKPQGFKYKSGQYMFVKCAAVSPFEWHPFSITSAPNDDYLSVHIRSLGDWTGEIKEVFSKVCQSSPTGKSEVLRAEFIRGDGINSNIKVSIDGPYGAPAQDYKNYDVVLLIGLGIGATPMISIVKDIVYNIKAKEEEENAIENVTGTSTTSGIGRTHVSPLKKKSPGPSSAGDFKTRKAYFYWITPSQGSFDWFKGVINEVTDIDKNGVIEMHNHCTSVYEEGNAQSALIAMLQSLYYAKHGIDIVTGTHVKSYFAKPDWQKVYKGIADKHTNSRVGVFYCGAPPPAAKLKQLAADFSRTTSTLFDFHKENF